MENHKKIDLCGEWTLHHENGEVSVGTVPGCVHTDLFHMEELFFEKNSEKSKYIENQMWKYTKEFEIFHLYENPVLVFEGLDTYSEIYLNGKKIGETENMFVPHRFSVGGVLKEGKNLIEVTFLSPISMVEGKEKLQGAFTTERLHSRRMQCTYGWDWVDRFVTAGIYKPVYIIDDVNMQLEHAYVYTNQLDSFSAQIKVVENFKNCKEGQIVKTEILDCEGNLVKEAKSFCQEEQMILYFDISNPQLWFPRPYGTQPLYTLRITIEENAHEEKFGIRTVKILQLEDTDQAVITQCQELQQTVSGVRWDQNETYRGFNLLINGKRIYCTGANWVPCEPFPSAETEEKITHILEKAVDAGVNMIRVWGGGLFEKEHFYKECDRLGILVTQDFLMACGNYPEKDRWFQEQLKKEAEYAAIYLRNHPSLVWWTGDNENAVEGCDTDRDYQGRTAAKKVIASVLERLDYHRVFLFSSPYGGKKYASKTCGTTHNTQFLEFIFEYMKKEDISDYREYWKEFIARFIAEEPIMGAVCKNSLNKFITPLNQDQYELWLYHTKNNPALGKELLDMMVEYCEKLLGSFQNWEDKYFKLRYLQYEWVRYTLSLYRSRLWFNSGVIYWMLNDCWPASMGWSLIDYYTSEKAGYYAMKHYGQPISIYIEKVKEGYRTTISNILGEDLLEKVKLRIFVLNLKTQGCHKLKEENVDCTTDLQTVEIPMKLAADEMLIAEILSENYFTRNWYREGNLELHETNALKWEKTEDGAEIWSDQYVHVVDIEGVDNVNDNYFSLLPGEKKKIHFEEGKPAITGYTVS